MKAEREPNVGNIFHLAQLLSCQNNNKMNRGQAYCCSDKNVTMLSRATKTSFSLLLRYTVTSIALQRQKPLNAKVMGQTRITRSFLSMFQASLIGKEFKTHLKISAQCLNYFLDGDDISVIFPLLKNNKTSGEKFLLHI